VSDLSPFLGWWTAEFVQAFWAFVRAGGYQAQEKSTGLK
jgi:hypothetical protein